jgi:hypothetical protein
MQKHALKLFLLGGAVLAAVSFGKPALAADKVVQGDVCAVLTDSTGTRIEVFNTGTARVLQCHHAPQPAPPCPPAQQQPCPPVPIPPPPPQAICNEAFAVCADSSFAVGAIGDTAFNLKLSDTCKVFLQEFNTDPDFGANLPIVTTLTPELLPDPDTGAPVFNLDDLPLGAVVNVQVVNQPNGKNIGVQTTFQHRVGTCKLCKIRKFFATSSVTITQVKEFELPCNPALFSQLAGPGGSDTAVASDTFGQFITLTTTGNTAANPSRADERFFQRSVAGSVSADIDFVNEELKDCGPTGIVPDRIDGRSGAPGSQRWIGILLSFRTSASSGVTIRPGFDKFLTF